MLFIINRSGSFILDVSKRTCLDFMGLMRNSKKNKIQVHTAQLQVERKIAIEAQKKKTLLKCKFHHQDSKRRKAQAQFKA